jgi:hypothetical protein
MFKAKNPLPLTIKPGCCAAGHGLAAWRAAERSEAGAAGTERTASTEGSDPEGGSPKINETKNGL